MLNEIKKINYKFYKKIVVFFYNNVLKEKEEEEEYIQQDIVKKPIDFPEAKAIAKKYTSKTFVRETGSSYRFRNIPKQKFLKESFITKKISKNLSLVLGKLKI